MSDADQYEPNQPAATGGQPAGSGEEIPVSRFEVVPTRQTNLPELYSFREAMAPPQAELAAKRKKNVPIPVARILLPLVLLAGAVLIFLAVPSWLQPKPPAPYIDMGSQRYDPAGLSGRLIARWEQSGSYQFFLDPIDPTQVRSFAAVAQDPSRRLSVTLRIRDAAGRVACQKQILFPASMARTPNAKFVAPSEPRETQNGDVVQNMTGEDGQVSEIDLTGPLPCGAKAYTSFKSWDFFTDFPTLAEQDNWMQHERELNGKGHGGNSGLLSQTQRLPTAIEGDDVIVGDNPSHGTVETSGGRVFFLGVAGLRNRTADWSVFPAPIHFHCDKNGSCVLTRPNSHVSLQARLLK
ncbi:MAG: hypothetical protein P4K93_05255 [Terracidiphilus sp.]|nr:hypothetical protein [Terracidiphilus sp.]